jgi:tetratricopeptide (TPR) repeat protein
VELDADRLGVLVAALAGYRVGAAIPVLQTIVARVGPDLFHPNPKERTLAIRDQVGEVVDHLEVFHLALYLLVTGRYLDAAQLLEQFLSVFPSREVMSAAGVAYHKEALRYAPAPEFRHLLAVDAASRVPATRGAPHPLFRQRLERAIYYYTLAVDADPGYAPALNNLGAAYLDLGERELALGHINRALREDPGLASAYNNRALVALASRDPKRAEEDLLAAARLAPGQREIATNLAHLYEREGRSDEARRWSPAARAEAPKSEAPDLAGAVTPGTATARLAEWLGEPGVRRITLPLGRDATRELTLLVFSRRGLAVVSRDGQVESVGVLAHAQAVSVRGVRAGDPAARIEAAYGRPAGLEGIQALNVWGFPARQLAFFVVGDRVQAIWAGRAASR